MSTYRSHEFKTYATHCPKCDLYACLPTASIYCPNECGTLLEVTMTDRVEEAKHFAFWEGVWYGMVCGIAGWHVMLLVTGWF